MGCRRLSLRIAQRLLRAGVLLAVLAALSRPAAAQSDWPAVASEPLATTPSREPKEPYGNVLRIKFRSDGPTWTARTWTCERVTHDQNFGGEQGCAMLMLQSGAERRYMPIQDSFQVLEPRLVALRAPDGRTGLLLTETSAVELHADLWSVHLIEDDGQGPRLVFRTLFDTCAWGDDSVKCMSVRVKAKYIDGDADGDQDLDFSFLGANGLRHHDRCLRQANGRFALPARYRRPDSYLHNLLTSTAKPIGADPAVIAASPGDPMECPWFVRSPHGKVKAYELRGGRGKVVATLVHDAPIEVRELRGGFALLGLPTFGWISARSIEQRCSK